MSTDIIQANKDMKELETNVVNTFLYYPEWNGKSVDIEEGRGIIYYSEQEEQEVENIVADIELAKVSPGCYKLEFIPSGWQVGLYFLILLGKYIDELQVEYEIRKELHFELVGVDRVQYLVWRIRNRLMDYPEFYILDRDKKGQSARYWTHQNFYGYLKDAVSRFNSALYYETDYNIEDFPVESLLLDGAQSYALFARGRLEKANTFSFADVPNVDRSSYYRDEGNRLLDDFDSRTKQYKSMQRTGGLWVRKQKIPYFSLRYLSFLPAFKNIL